MFNGDVNFDFRPMDQMPPMHACLACDEVHAMGWCRLKVAGVEHCGLCGLAHLGHGRTCPQLTQESHVKMLLQTLKESTESKDLIDQATKYLRMIKGDLIQRRRAQERKELEAKARRMETEKPMNQRSELQIAAT